MLQLNSLMSNLLNLTNWISSPHMSRFNLWLYIYLNDYWMKTGYLLNPNTQDRKNVKKSSITNYN